jgi:hypothetical protein
MNNRMANVPYAIWLECADYHDMRDFRPLIDVMAWNTAPEMDNVLMFINVDQYIPESVVSAIETVLATHVALPGSYEYDVLEQWVSKHRKEIGNDGEH